MPKQGAGLALRLRHHGAMAHGPKKGSLNKSLLQQRLKTRAKIVIAKADKGPSEVHRYWLVRHAERQNGHCAYCGVPMLLPPARGRKTDRLATLDHVVPLAHGGADSEANTVAACEACNTAKADISAQVFSHSAFLAERKVYAATISPRPPRPVVVNLRRTRPKRAES